MANVILHSYNFESDNESHINADELSELSDEFEDEQSDEDAMERSKPAQEGDPNPTLSIDDIPYDRDLKFVNVPNASRPKANVFTGSSKGGSNRLLKQVADIAKGNMRELKELDEHYRKLDDKKKAADEKFGKSFNDRRNRSSYYRHEEAPQENFGSEYYSKDKRIAKEKDINSHHYHRTPNHKQNDKPKNRNNRQRSNFYEKEYPSVENPQNSPLPNNYIIEEQNGSASMHNSSQHQQQQSVLSDSSHLNPFAQEFVPSFMLR